MDWSCLIGVCSAMAQAAGQVAGEAASAAAAAGAASASGNGAVEGDGAKEASYAITAVGIVIVVLSQLLAPWVLARYRRRLLHFMGTGSRKALGLAELRADEPWTAQRLPGAMEAQRLRVLYLLVAVVACYSLAATWLYAYPFESRGDKITSMTMSSLMFAAFSGPVVLIGVSAANFGRMVGTWFAPATFAAVAMQSILAPVPDPDAERRGMLWALAGVLAFTGAIVALRHYTPRGWWDRALAAIKQRRVASAGGAIALAIVLAAVLGLWLEGRPGAQKFVIGCVFATLAIVLCWFTMIDRVQRIVVPLLAAGIFTLALAFGLTLAGLLALWGDAGWLGIASAALGAAVVGLLVANFVLSWIGLAYEQKVFSDAQFQVFCWMLAVSGVIISAETFMHGNPIWDGVNGWLALSTGIALLLYWLVTRFVIQPLGSDKRLLVLRVFAQDARGEQLLDEIEYRWRFIGPIVLIGGPDIAARTIDPAKAANFLRLRLRDTFVPNLATLHKRVAAMDETPDPDGRYRVSEFFCFDDLWQQAVQLLLASSDAVVLDLRGYTAARKGTGWELGQLKERGALARTVFLVNETTKLDDVCAALHLPPGSKLPASEVIDVQAHVDGRTIVEALVRGIPQAPLPEARPDMTLVAKAA